MKKRILSICLVAALVAGLIAPAVAGPSEVYAASFSDTGDHWAEKYVASAVKKGFVKGYPDGTFRPDQSVTRAEFTTMVNKAFGNSQTASLSFRDVPSAEWYYNDISKAVAATYAAGYDDNTFKPGSPITRQEAAVMISRLIPSYGYSGNLRSFGDSSSVADWATTAMQKVNGKGYIGAYDDGLIHPLDKLTRAQTAKILCDITDKETIVTSDPMVKSDGTKLSGKIYSNGVTIHKDLGDKSASLDNVVILGTLSVQGGGANTVTVSNSRVASCQINRSSSPVRVLAKGEVVISNATVNNTAVLETSGLAGGLYGSGFGAVGTNSSADVTLKGTFPKVSILGSNGNIKAESASITTLNVESSGKNSDITVDSRSSVATANVNGASYFHGDGTISKMNANASGITYETKPKTWTIASGVSSPTYSDAQTGITFDPKNTATGVKLDIKPTITFSTAVTKYNGKAISNSDLTDMIELHKKTASGTEVDFSASINSSKKVITITPDELLDEDTRYYITIDKNTFLDADDEGNDAQSIYFNTGDGTSDDVTFSPRDGASGISTGVEPTIKFNEAIETYKGSKITDSYIEDEVTLRDVTSSKDISFDGSISSDRKTITIDPDGLTSGHKYTLSFSKNVFRTVSGEKNISSDSATWTVGSSGSSDLSSLSISANGTSSITLSFTPDEKGTVYAIVVPTADDYKTPTADMVRTGKYYTTNSKTTSALARTNKSVSANSSNSITLNYNYSAGTNYTVYAYLDGTSSGDSSVVSKSITVNTKVDVSSIDTAISLANTAKNGVKVSTNGADVYADESWVTQAQMNVLTSAITTATSKKSSVKTTSEAQTAANALNAATNTFNGQKKRGSKQRIDVSALSSEITAAENLLNSVVSKPDKTDDSTIEQNTKFAYAPDWNNFNSAISAAKSVRDNPASSSAVSNAISALQSAKDVFNGKIRYGSKAPINKSALGSKINEANEALGSVPVDTNSGKDTDPVNWWVAPIDHTALSNAISKAQGVYDNASTVQLDVDNAVTALGSAISTFNTAKQPGTKSPTETSPPAIK